MVKLLFFGDVRIHPQQSRLVSDTLAERIKEHQLVSGNLEGPITSSESPIKKIGDHIKQSSNTGKILSDAGFTLLSIANDHISDYGTLGIQDTKNALNQLHTVGAGTTFAEAYAPHIAIIGGRRIGFLSFAEWGFGAADDETSGGFAWVNHPSVNHLVRTTRTQVDILIVQVHAGVPETSVPLPEWRHRYRELIDAGASTVIAHHPQRIQGSEHYGRGCIFYSLGNFSFTHNTPSGYGMGLSLTFENNSITAEEYIPLVCDPGGVVSIDTTPSGSTLIAEAQNYIDTDYPRVVDTLIATLWEERYRHFYQRSLGGYHTFRGFLLSLTRAATQKDVDYTLLSHNLNIESHRFAAMRAAKLLSEK